MPRLSPSLIRHAFGLSPYLALLLRATRDLPSAQNELRWLKEHAAKTARLARRNPQRHSIPPPTLEQLCRARASGRPLQYILGSQPFGELEILCQPGVLVPRPETETYAAHLSSLLQLHRAGAETSLDDGKLHILDLCAGTGCIGLLLYTSLRKYFPNLYVRGVDINPFAKKLAEKTILLNRRLGRLPSDGPIGFEYLIGDIGKHDIGSDGGREDGHFDVVVSNPPYISVPAFSRDTSRSTRCFEPRVALVPPPSPAAPGSQGEETGDVFYWNIIRIAAQRHAKVVVMEVADLEQAERVLGIVGTLEESEHMSWDVKQVWCDQIEAMVDATSEGQRLPYTKVGSGGARAVVLARGWAVPIMSSRMPA